MASTQASLTLPVRPRYSQQNSKTIRREIGQLHHLHRLQINEWQTGTASCTKHLCMKMTTFRHLSCHLIAFFCIQVDQKVSVHLMMITVQKNMQKYFKQFQSLTMIWRWHHRIHSECGPCYTEHGLWRTQCGTSINIWRLAGDTMNITCNQGFFSIKKCLGVLPVWLKKITIL
jgi:hypothetical protein